MKDNVVIDIWVYEYVLYPNINAKENRNPKLLIPLVKNIKILYSFRSIYELWGTRTQYQRTEGVGA